MQAYRIETMLTQGGRLTLDHLPFRKGETVEIIILHQPMKSSSDSKDFPLRGTVLNYTDPTTPIAQEDWEVLQ